MSRNWHIHKKGGCTAVGEPGSSFTREVVLLNPDQKRWYRHAYVLWFGGCGATYLHVYADSLDAAIEECAGWLADHAPGHIMKEWSDEHKDLVKDACSDAEIAYNEDLFSGSIATEMYSILESAEADLTRTESGFLTSYEWGLSLEDPDADALYTFIQGQ